MRTNVMHTILTRMRFVLIQWMQSRLRQFAYRMILALLLTASAQETAAQSQPLVIAGGTLINGTGADPIPDAVVVMEGSRITAAGPRQSISLPANARIIRAEGKTVLPGLIDAHIHFLDFMPPLFLHFGVTTVIDTANPTDWIIAQRDALKSGRYPGPRLFVTGLVIDGPVGPEGALSTADRGGYKIRVRSAEEARLAVRNVIQQGVDGVKVHEQLTNELLRAVVEESHKSGREVVGHSRDAREAAVAGLKFLEHSTPVAQATLPDPAKRAAAEAGKLPIPEADMDPALFDSLIDLLVKNEVYFNPTLSRQWITVMPKYREWTALAAKYLEDPVWRFIPAARREFWLRAAKATELAASPEVERRKEGSRRLNEFIRRFAQAGGKFVAGPDSGPSSGPANLAGLAMHIEMEALVDAGLTPMQAILASTKWPAELMRLEKDLGTVVPGKLADLILVDGNPLADIRATRQISAVILGGKLVDTALDPDFQNPLPRPVYVDTPLEYMAPEITSIAPRMATQNDNAVTVEITGKKFAARSFVRFDTTDLPTRIISDTRLSATIGRNLLKNAGTYAVTVVNPGSGGGTSNVSYFVVNYRD